MLTCQNDIPVSIYGFGDYYIRVIYRSRDIVAFPYEFFIDNVEIIVSLPLLSALEIPESIYLGPQ